MATSSRAKRRLDGLTLNLHHTKRVPAHLKGRGDQSLRKHGNTRGVREVVKNGGGQGALRRHVISGSFRPIYVKGKTGKEGRLEKRCEVPRLRGVAQNGRDREHWHVNGAIAIDRDDCTKGGRENKRGL